jgi:hypothetical protein
MEEKKDAYRNIPFDRKYSNLIDDISEATPEKNRDAVRQVLSSESAYKTYKILDKSMSPKEARQIMIHGIEDFSKGRPISSGKYAAAITQELLEHDKYHEAAEGMLDRGIISKSQYAQIKKSIKRKTKEHGRSLQSGLEKLASSEVAAWILIAVGITIMATAKPSISGAVIGISTTTTLPFLAGLVAFISGVVLLKKK